jgi:D-amino peptidase
VAGDDALADEVADWLPWAERVIVKIGSGGNAAASLHPSRAGDLIRAAAERAVRRAAAGEVPSLVVDRPTSIEVDYAKAAQADFAAIAPGAERIGDRGVRHTGPDPVAAYRGFLAGFRLAEAVE